MTQGTNATLSSTDLRFLLVYCRFPIACEGEALQSVSAQRLLMYITSESCPLFYIPRVGNVADTANLPWGPKAAHQSPTSPLPTCLTTMPQFCIALLAPILFGASICSHLSIPTLGAHLSIPAFNLQARSPRQSDALEIHRSFAAPPGNGSLWSQPLRGVRRRWGGVSE